MNAVPAAAPKAPVDEAALARAVARIAARKATAQLCVLRDGAVVVDHAHGCRPDALFWIFSAGKPFATVLIYVLAERGQVDLDAPVAQYWPAFAQAGKAAITIRNVLQHRSGLPRVNIGDVRAMSDWEAFTRRIAQTKPVLAPGEGPIYQALAYGYILGEIVQRVTGRTLRAVLDEEILKPLAMNDTTLGLSDDRWPRRVPVSGRGALGHLVAAIMNTRTVRRAANPSAGICTTARDMAAFYQMLLAGGTANGRRFLMPSSIADALTLTSDGAFDIGAQKPIRWAQGFQLGGPRSDGDSVPPMGMGSSPLTFGHNGSNSCIAWADPTRRIAFAYLTDRLGADREPVQHLAAVADDILAACAPI